MGSDAVEYICDKLIILCGNISVVGMHNESVTSNVGLGIEVTTRLQQQTSIKEEFSLLV